MSTPFTTADLTRLESTARSLLSPLAFPTLAAWQSEVTRALGALLGGDHSLFRLPTGNGEFYTDDGAEIVQGLMTFAQQVTPEMITYWDDTPNVWHRDRRALGIEAFNFDIVSDVIRQGGFSIARAPVWNEVFFRNGVFDYAGLITTRPEGDAILWTLSPRLRNSNPDGQVALLRTLVPAFRAGLEAIDRFDAHRTTLDLVAEPLAVFDADGREIHRNPALVGLLARDPDAASVEAGLLRLARQMRPLGFPRLRDTVDHTALTFDVATAHTRYTLSGSLLRPDVFGPREAFLLSVRAQATHTAFPSPDDLRARFNLTKREAETALLVAQGLSNDTIAERLFVSRHTVRHHVESLTAKMDLSGKGRGAVAARLLALQES